MALSPRTATIPGPGKGVEHSAHVGMNPLIERKHNPTQETIACIPREEIHNCTAVQVQISRTRRVLVYQQPTEPWKDE